MSSSEFLPGWFQHSSLLLFRPRPTKLAKEFAQKLFMKGNVLQVVLGRIITRYPPLSIDLPVGLEVEVIANWPQNCSISLGLARKHVFVFVSSCNPSCNLFHFVTFFSLSFIILLLLRLSHSLPCLRIRPLSWPGVRLLSWLPPRPDVEITPGFGPK